MRRREHLLMKPWQQEKRAGHRWICNKLLLKKRFNKQKEILKKASKIF